MTDLRFHTPLSAAEQRAAGLPEPWPLAVADRVRFAEIDVLNHVNNAAYMVWFESVRIRYFQAWGLTRYGADDPRCVIRRAELDYLAEMVMDEVYIVTARCAAFRRTSFTLDSEIWSGGTCRAALRSIIVTLEPDRPEKRPLSAAVRRRFIEVDGAAEGG